MAKDQSGRGFKNLSASKQAVHGGSGSMVGFKAVGNQAPGGTAVKGSGGGKNPGAKVSGGSGKMQKFTPVKPQKSGKTSVTN